MDVTGDETRYFEDYLEATGWGLYNYFLVALACACNFVQAASYAAIPLAVVLSTCNGNFIPEHVTLRIFTTFYLGSCFGGFVANSLSDRYGRKRYLSYSLMFVFMSTFVAAFAFNAYIVMGASLFLGVGMEVNIVSIKLLVIEIIPKEKRGAYMVFCNLCWSLGYIFITVLIILLETPLISNREKIPDPGLTSWRVMFAVCGGANLLLACSCALIEESPRYFLQMGRSYLAYLVLKQLYAINNSDFAENFKIKEEDIKNNSIPHYDLFYMEPESYWDIFKKLSGRLCQSVRLMFTDRFCRTTWLLILMKTPVTAVGVLGLNIVLAKKLTTNTLTDTTQDKYRGLDFVYPLFKPLSYMSEQERNKSTSICAVDDYNRTFYMYFLILGSAMIPGLLTSMFIVDRIGRKFTLFAALLLAFWSFLTLCFIKRNIYQLVLSMMILAAITSVIALLSLVTLEAYPTAIRGTSCAVTNFLGLFMVVFYINCIVIEFNNFIIIMGAICMGMCLSTLFLPELALKSMVE